MYFILGVFQFIGAVLAFGMVATLWMFLFVAVDETIDEAVVQHRTNRNNQQFFNQNEEY